jgi:hypothetical protein
MASIAPIVIGCNDYLAYRTIFTRAMFCPKIKLDVFFSARKAVDELWAGGAWWTGHTFNLLNTF